MTAALIRTFITSESGAMRIDGISVGAAGIGLVIAGAAAVMINSGGFQEDAQSGSMGLHRAPEVAGPPERLDLIEVLGTRTTTECAPVYEDGPVACGSTIRQSCTLWRMSDGTERQFCERV